ncbi:3'-5' exonuclease [Candidatus Woesearchaeota archaeon]|nr:3'-5' exonuclease [Candidatus Woesearchaeota archaeon]
MGDDKYTILDIETTGLSRYTNEITEIAAIKMKGNKVIEEFQTLINPGVPIPKFITRLTGIDDEMVKDAPSIEKALPRFLKFLGSTTIVAHCATFDYGFLSHKAEKHLKTSIENKRLCTRKLANRLVPDLPSKKLMHLCTLFRIKNEQAHRAMGDTRATLRIFKKFLAMMKIVGVKTHDEIIKFETTSPSKIREMLN